MAKILPCKTSQQLETAVLVMQEWEAHFEWEEVNWHHLEKRGAEEGLSQDKLEWLYDWLQDDK